MFQLEKGESGYEHYQGRISLKVKSRLPKWPYDKIHWSPTSKANSDNDFYVTKEETRTQGPWKDTDENLYIPRQIREIKELHPWQQQVADSRHTWDTRTINVLVDTKGNNGKSILKTYIGCQGLGRSLPFMNDYRDIMRMVMDTPKKTLYIIDIPRALRKDALFQFFSGVETLKDGYAFDDRYHFREAYFDCPTIWVFMNMVPDTEMMSKDRWKYWTIDNLKLIPYEWEPQDIHGI